ncbi:hypothetical protein T310_10075 [Rasamsonia emersonii CBS 393.64]|uniref:DUF7924 domain-containing protein n=1 Tax=Rasamsonia emersonii (strain ATCC 16479 / CBS 393.64 / IMI 116815) TaxID=1408163 RepID=A0A0F4YEK0_RASE3|nr:hypothetical protein T310_10075 [Rasamsonia emersonii CBS 393.64]KKA16341.1 hypothetical protein T310_10075 [Rasamsonia emersonii CBS 393.64]
MTSAVKSQKTKTLKQPIRRSARLMEKDALQRQTKTQQIPAQAGSTSQKQAGESEGISEKNLSRAKRLDATSALEHWVQEHTWPEGFGFSVCTRSMSGYRSTYPGSDLKSPGRTESAYRNARYELHLEQERVYMTLDACGINDRSKEWCRRLATTQHEVPPRTLFRDDLFASTIERTSGNEISLLRLIGDLIVPSAVSESAFRGFEFTRFAEAFQETWVDCKPLQYPPPPRPDYALGFPPSAFSEHHRQRLAPLLGGVEDPSELKATPRLYFPFLACEAKRLGGDLKVADRQNMHSMTLGVRAVVTLFQRAELAKELDREVLAFSISHDSQIAKNLRTLRSDRWRQQWARLLLSLSHQGRLLSLP